jgi:hypothetical protein
MGMRTIFYLKVKGLLLKMDGMMKIENERKSIGGRLSKFAMSCAFPHSLRKYTTLQTSHQENVGKSPRSAYCTKKVTIFFPPYLPPLSCLAHSLTPASAWYLFGNTKNLCDYKPLAPLEPAEPEPAARYCIYKRLTPLVILFCVVLSYAQPIESSTAFLPTDDNIFNKAELVFEGNFVRYAYTYNTTGNTKYDDNYLISAYQVKKVYKGDQSLLGGQVFIVTQGASFGIENDSFIDASLSFWSTPVLERNGITQAIHHYSPFIYFCATSDYPDDIDSNFSSYKKYMHFENNRENKLYIIDDIIFGLDENLFFDNRLNFYDYIRKFEDYIVPEIDTQPKEDRDEVLEKPIEWIKGE